MNSARIVTSAIFTFFFFCLPAMASHISLITSLTTKVENGALHAVISTVNRGDESAFNVQAEISVGAKKLLAEKRAELEVNGVYRTEFAFPVSFSIPGTYPVILFMHYTDANQYPFSALSSKTFNYNAPDSPQEVFGEASVVSISKKGEFKFRLKNLGEDELLLSCYLIVPRELSVADNKRIMRLPARAEQELNFPIENFSALFGSDYQVFAVAEYNNQGIHQTMITPGLIKVVKTKSILGLKISYLIAILVLLLVVFCSAQFMKKISRI